MADLISCTPAEYHAVQQSLTSLRATLEKAAAAPAGSKLHRGIAYFQRGITRYEAFLASHSRQIRDGPGKFLPGPLAVHSFETAVLGRIRST